jgi:hypothetical protein
MASTPLHPTRARAREYEADFKDVVQRIEDAVRRSHATGRKYAKVHVLCLRWTNDDLGLGPISDTLLQTFEALYQFPTETFIINHAARNLLWDVNKKVLGVLRTIQGTDSLFIVVYQGHADRSSASREDLLI